MPRTRSPRGAARESRSGGTSLLPYRSPGPGRRPLAIGQEPHTVGLAGPKMPTDSRMAPTRSNPSPAPVKDTERDHTEVTAKVRRNGRCRAVSGNEVERRDVEHDIRVRLGRDAQIGEKQLRHGRDLLGEQHLTARALLLRASRRAGDPIPPGRRSRSHRQTRRGPATPGGRSRCLLPPSWAGWYRTA